MKRRRGTKDKEKPTRAISETMLCKVGMCELLGGARAKKTSKSSTCSGCKAHVLRASRAAKADGKEKWFKEKEKEFARGDSDEFIELMRDFIIACPGGGKNTRCGQFDFTQYVEKKVLGRKNLLLVEGSLIGLSQPPPPLPASQQDSESSGRNVVCPSAK